MGRLDPLLNAPSLGRRPAPVASRAGELLALLRWPAFDVAALTDPLAGTALGEPRAWVAEVTPAPAGPVLREAVMAALARSAAGDEAPPRPRGVLGAVAAAGGDGRLAGAAAGRVAPRAGGDTRLAGVAVAGAAVSARGRGALGAVAAGDAARRARAAAGDGASGRGGAQRRAGLGDAAPARPRGRFGAALASDMDHRGETRARLAAGANGTDVAAATRAGAELAAVARDVRAALSPRPASVRLGGRGEDAQATHVPLGKDARATSARLGGRAEEGRRGGARPAKDDDARGPHAAPAPLDDALQRRLANAVEAIERACDRLAPAPDVAWLDDDEELAGRLGRVLARQARAQGIGLT